MTELKSHPLADLFPMIGPDEFRSLCADIRQNGLIEPIVLFEDKILDGRNRYNACQAVGVEPVYERHKFGDPLEFIVSKNLRRRHLNESQRAIIAAKISNLKRGNPNFSRATVAGLSIDKAAKLLNVSPTSVDRARRVLRDQPRENVEKIIAGAGRVGSAKRSSRIDAIAYLKACDAVELPDWLLSRHAGEYGALVVLRGRSFAEEVIRARMAAAHPSSVAVPATPSPARREKGAPAAVRA